MNRLLCLLIVVIIFKNVLGTMQPKQLHPIKLFTSSFHVTFDGSDDDQEGDKDKNKRELSKEDSESEEKIQSVILQENGFTKKSRKVPKIKTHSVVYVHELQRQLKSKSST